VNQLVDPPEKGDQYGFNQPVVAEMREKYGVDILTDMRFDVFNADFKIDDPMVENWRNLRGEHITQFYRELRKALNAVDPKIQIAVTLSGEHAGPPIGNQRMDWRAWVDEGLIDVIIAPVFFEATFDHDAGKKGYLTHVREGIGVLPFQDIKDYIAKSKHPEIQVISTGATAYFNQPPPKGADGWRVDVWYELYTSAWYQRWSQWMADMKDFGQIHFIKQNFDLFPADPTKLPPAGSAGLVAYDPKIRACPGGWYPFGDEESGKALIQDKIRRGETGNAIRLTSNGSNGPSLIGYHNADVDRSNISARLSTSITNGTCRYSLWIYRENEESGVITYLENQGGELDVGLKVEPNSGLVSYTTGRGPGGTGTWKPTTFHVPVGQWQRLSINVDFPTASYSAHAGPNDEMELVKGIPYSPPKPRTTMQNGVNIEIPVPSYKSFRQVLIHPIGAAGTKTYLDDLDVIWKPDLVFTPNGENVLFSDDFEKNERDANLNGLIAGQGGKWVTIPDKPEAFQVITSTSYREGEKSVLLSRRGDIKPVLAKPVKLTADNVLTFDADLFIRSDAAYPFIIPGQATSSPNEVRLIIENAETNAIVAEAIAAQGKWTLNSGKKPSISEVTVPYDCWMHVQLSVDMTSHELTLVQQQIGQVAQKLATAPLPADFQAGQPLAFRINLGASNSRVVLDNVRITIGTTESKSATAMLK